MGYFCCKSGLNGHCSSCDVCIVGNPVFYFSSFSCHFLVEEKMVASEIGVDSESHIVILLLVYESH